MFLVTVLVDEVPELHEILKGRGGNGLSFKRYTGDAFWCNVSLEGETDDNYLDYISGDEEDSGSEDWEV